MQVSQHLANEFWKNLGQISLRDYAPKDAYDNVVTSVWKLIVSKDEQQLIDLAFNDNLTQVQLDDFLQKWDIECYGAQKALLLAYVQKKWPQLDFGAYTAPRLKGLRSYYRFHNLEQMSQYRKIVEKLNRANIIPLIIKGGAIKYLRPELPRVMGDIDILISEPKQYKQALKIVATMKEYTLSRQGHSVDLYKKGTNEGVLDIHHCLDDHFADYDKLSAQILKRATVQKVFGVQSLVPSNEDLVFILLFNLGKNIIEYSSISGIMYIVFDLAYLISKPDFDWQLVRQNIKLTSTYGQIYLACTFINKMVKGLLPDLLNCADAKKIEFALNKFYFYERFIHIIRQRRKELYLGQVVLGRQSLKEYVSVKSKYHLLKHIWRSPLLLKLFFRVLKGYQKWNI